MEETLLFTSLATHRKNPGEHFYIKCHYALSDKVVLSLPLKDPKENQLIEMH